jgi:hypothetical protein
VDDAPLVHRDGADANPEQVAEWGRDLASWAAEQTERVRELRMEADQLEQESDWAFNAARILLP